MNVKVNELMTESVVTTQPHATVSHVRGMLERNKIGAVPVALNLRSSPAELGFVIADSGCKVIIVGPAFAALLEQAVRDLPAVPAIISSEGGGGHPALAAMRPAPYVCDAPQHGAQPAW